MTRAVRLGLTGPIGCGKSTIARWLGEEGGAVIDADMLAREATAPGTSTLPAIRERFGVGMLRDDGSLDRAALAAVVFVDPDALRDLEAIVHPEVRRLLLAAVARADAERAPYVVIEAIKLVEGGYAADCDVVWVVECAPATQRERLLARGHPPDDADRRLATQGPHLAARLAASVTTRVRRIATDGARPDVRERVAAALREDLAAAGATD